MFFHDLKYGLKMALRNKTQIFWSLIFTIILGSLFYASFGNIYEKELASSIDVVCYIEDPQVKAAFDASLTEVTMNDDGDKLLNITYAKSLKEADELLDDNVGLFYSEDGELKLSIKENGIYESVLANIVRQFHQKASIIMDAGKLADEKIMQQIIGIMSDTAENNIEKKITSADMDPYLIYFYNLLAMSCLFASFAVLDITSRNQGNLSAVGARKCASSANVVKTSIAELLAHLIIMYAIVILSFLYLSLIGVKFGTKIPAILITLLAGVILGTSFGFFIGSMKLQKSIKEGIATGVSLMFCFFSGLMIANIRPYIEENCPIFDKINPASMICDSLYSLYVYDGYDRLYFNLISMGIVSLIFIIGGIIVGRRKSYASL